MTVHVFLFLDNESQSSYNNQSTESTESRALVGCFFKLKLLDLFYFELGMAKLF